MADKRLQSSQESEQGKVEYDCRRQAANNALEVLCRMAAEPPRCKHECEQEWYEPGTWVTVKQGGGPGKLSHRSVRYLVQGYLPGGRQVRSRYTNYDEASMRREALELEARSLAVDHQVVRTRLTPEQVAEAEGALRRLTAAAVARPELATFTLSDAVDYFTSNFRPERKSASVSEAVAAFKRRKAQKDLRDPSLDEYKSRQGFLVSVHPDKQVDQITTDDLEQIILQKDVAARTQNHIRAKFHALFSFCHQQGWCETNPAKQIEKARVQDSEPEILPVETCRKLMVAACGHKDGILVPYLALSLFGGLRPGEISRLKPTDVNLPAGVVSVAGGRGKRRKRRKVEMMPNLIEWLVAYRRTGLCPRNFRRHFDAVRRAAGYRGSSGGDDLDENRLPWIPDVLRHSCLTAHFTHYGNDGKTARFGGTSVDMLHDSYRGLMTREEAESCWAITPATMEDKVISLESVAA